MAQIGTDVGQSSEKRTPWRLITAWAGIIGPVLFFVVSMIDGFLHPNYSTLNEPISNLGAKAPNAWIQNVNFFLSGLLLVIFAIGFFRLLRPMVRRWWVIVSTFFLVLTGVCLALASIFPTDIPGYPPLTLHGQIHDIIFFVVFGTLLIGVLLSGLLLRNIPGWHRYGWYSIIEAIVMLLLFVTLAWVMCSILLIYMFILLNRQEYLSFFETLVLVCILFAMLRTRLADPTLLVNRTLVYSIFAVCFYRSFFPMDLSQPLHCQHCSLA